MKKQILFAAAVLFSAGMIFMTGCKKDDTTGPVITLVGDAEEESILNAAWTDKGATAEDAEDGPVDVTVSGTVDKDLAGDYEITYTATDAAGNTSTAKRTVTVYNEARILANLWSVHDSCGVGAVFNYGQTVTASTTVNKRILFNKFADYSGNTGIYAEMTTATSLTLPSQTVVGIGSLSQNHTFSGTGTISSPTFTLNYTDNNTTTSSIANCTAKFQ